MRDVWLIVGATILVALVLESAVRAALFFKHRLGPAEVVVVDSRVRADTYAGADWVYAYYEEFHRPIAARYQWNSYVYWRRSPYRGKYLNVDEDGTRRTVAAAQSLPAQPARVRIFLFGGSAMWGEGVRDAYTIPSLLGQQLRGDGTDAAIFNFGESAYVSTQEVVALMLRLQKGDIPDLVIFYDGFNDVYSAYQQRVAGLPQNEFNRAKEFNLTHPQKATERSELFFRDVARSSSTVNLLERLLHHQAMPLASLGQSNVVSAALSVEVAETYRSNIEIVKALSDRYGFNYLFYLQPTLFQKPSVTPYERERRERWASLGPFLLATYAKMREAGSEAAGIHFRDLSAAFADAADPYFIDGVHIGETGNQVIANIVSHDTLSRFTGRP